MSEPLLEVEDLTIQYDTPGGKLTAVSNATFTVERGEYFGLVGESGSGKSTIVKAVLGALDDNGEIASGVIRYKGEEIQDYTEAELNKHIRWKEISWIPQSSMNSLDPLIRISDQAVGLAEIHTDLSKEAALDRFKEMFEVVGLSPNRVSDYPHQFSGGMKQRAMIALALFLDPELILADEPTTALDVIMQDQVFEYLDRIKTDTDTSMMLITHDISVVFESCDDMAIMHGGQVAETGTVSDVFGNPKHPYSILLQRAFPDLRFPGQTLEVIEGHPPQSMGEVNACTFAGRCPWAVEECEQAAPALEPVADGDGDHRAGCFRKDEVLELYEADADGDAGLTEAVGGRDDPQRGAQRGTADGPASDSPVIELRNLKKYFDQTETLRETLLPWRSGKTVQAVDGVTMSIDRNQSIAIIGESGCGKSTLLNTLMGLYRPTDGELLFEGQDVSEFDRGDWKRFRRNVQIIFQDPFESLNPKMTVRETLKEPLKIHGLDDQERRVREILETVELAPPEKYLGRLPEQLSGGEKQRVSIARALILDPDVILADEPVSMLDVSTQAAILNLLSRLTNEMDVALVYVSHDLSTVSYVCDEINVMYLGRIVESGPTADIIADPKHPYSQALINAVPVPDPNHHRERAKLEGAPQEPIDLGEGCRFRDRCPERMEACEFTPRSHEEAPGHQVACHLYYEHLADQQSGDGTVSSEASVTTEVESS
jgi:peptide/nickel transport system ATP-binding protein